MRAMVTDIYTWSWLSPKHGYSFNGFAIISREGLVVEDDFTRPGICPERTPSKAVIQQHG